jgi:hypothetical protein
LSGGSLSHPGRRPPLQEGGDPFAGLLDLPGVGEALDRRLDDLLVDPETGLRASRLAAATAAGAVAKQGSTSAATAPSSASASAIRVTSPSAAASPASNRRPEKDTDRARPSPTRAST